MRLKFLGATQNVTGSRFLLENENHRILIDCGLFQERALRFRNWEDFPVSPSSIDAVILTHAHLDHCGYLPKFVKEGFKGNIFCTPPTMEIAQIALLDSAKLQEEDAIFKKKRHQREGRKGPYPEIPLYTIEETQKVFPHFVTLPYHKEFQITPDIKVTFYDAGHILGAGIVVVRLREGTKKKTVVFSGDIGRWGKPILCDPATSLEADYVVMESTYGNRIHEEQHVSEEKLQRVIVETQKRGGNVLIPTFAIERAQELLYYLSKLLRENKIPHLLIFVDSPMAIDVTEVFRKYVDYFDKETKTLLKTGNSPFDFPLLKLTRSTGESKAINYIRGTSVIMAGSGMCTGGRIKHHLRNNITRPESTILFVGYQAKGTLGREILEKKEKVRIHGEFYPVQAKIEKINGFSAHADKNELLRWISSFRRTPGKIFVVHGEEEASTEFAHFLKTKSQSDIIVPEYLQEISL
ncbi:MBL fold metallo-hydrolase [Candidatus Calescamantes bacterium]|nr:MBL fold metallo-hydrolase [Candidatus Calescamantes bacterium]